MWLIKTALWDFNLPAQVTLRVLFLWCRFIERDVTNSTYSSSADLPDAQTGWCNGNKVLALPRTLLCVPHAYFIKETTFSSL